MRALVFAYHDMGVTGLEALLRADFQIAAVFSHADDPQENCWFGSVPEWAREREIPLYLTENVNDREWVEKISALAPEVIFSFYYRRLLCGAILAIPPAGAFNLHGSFLPHYRGRCPVNWVLVKGETRTGVTLHYMTERADAGDIVAQRAVAIDFDDTARTLYGKMCREASLMLDEALPLIKNGTAPRTAQAPGAGSYFGGRKPADGRIDWNWPALRIYNLIRAVTDPYPGAFAFTERGERVIIWRALPEAFNNAGKPGTLSSAGADVFVETGDGRIRLIEVEIEGLRLQGEAIGNYLINKEGKMLL